MTTRVMGGLAGKSMGGRERAARPLCSRWLEHVLRTYNPHPEKHFRAALVGIS
jgi:hypothetical protein